jgi:hypothetical protein
MAIFLHSYSNHSKIGICLFQAIERVFMPAAAVRDLDQGQDQEKNKIKNKQQ